MRKLVKSYGNTFVLVLSKEDQEIYNIEEGDTIDLGEIIVIKNRKRKKK